MTDSSARPSATTVVAGLFLAAGVVLAGSGLFLHVEIAGYLSAGDCDGCSPWHPLFVVAPILVGTAAALGSGYVLAR